MPTSTSSEPDLGLKALQGYELSTSCVDPDQGTTLFPSGIAKVDLDQDETVSCTFTFTRSTAIEVVLDMVPDSDLDVPFDIKLQSGGTLESFSLDDDSDPTLPASHVKATLADEYFVGRDLGLKALRLRALDQLVDPNQGTTLFPSGIAKVDLDQDETVSCTFTFTRSTAIEVVLDMVPDSDLDVPFDIKLQSGGTLESFSLDDDSDPTLPASHVKATLADEYFVGPGPGSQGTPGLRALDQLRRSRPGHHPVPERHRQG